jgi:hypothetical protein
VAEAVIASADTLLGRLQRGRGQGYLDALAGDRGDANAALIECVRSDPRTDSQVESRDEYYGRIAIEIDLDLSPLEAFLLGPQPAEATVEDWRDVLALHTLSWMGRLGRDDAVALLRRYIEVGEDWDCALEAMTWPTVLNVEGLADMAAKRAASVDDLARALPFELDREPWVTWRRTNERIGEAATRSHLWYTQSERRRTELSRQSTEELLQHGKVSALRGRASESDRAVLLRAASGDDPKMRHDAIKELGWQRDPRVLDAAEAELRRFPDREWPPNAGAIAIFHLLKQGPLPRVRGWLGEPGRPGEVAMRAVAEWPEPGDETLLRSMTERFRDDDWLYRACDAVDALVQLGDSEATPLLETIFKETTYSYLRHRVARGLAVLSPTFARGLATECLWDCEDLTVAVGCTAVDLASKAARDRLTRLAADGLISRRIHVLAGRRLRPLANRRATRSDTA